MTRDEKRSSIAIVGGLLLILWASGASGILIPVALVIMGVSLFFVGCLGVW
jgi:hypothetical protein